MKLITKIVLIVFFCLLVLTVVTHDAEAAENYTCTNSSTCTYTISTTNTNTSWFNGILFLPIALALYFLYFSNSFESYEVAKGSGEEVEYVNQEPLKWFFRLLSLLLVLVTYIGANIVIEEEGNHTAFESIFNIDAANWIFYTVIGVFLIYFIYKIFNSFQIKKKLDFEMGRLK